MSEESVQEASGRGISGLKIELPNSNLYINGWGLDINGNMKITLSFPQGRGFSIQTHEIQDTDSIIRGKGLKGGRKDKTFTEKELKTIENDVVDFVQNYGSKDQKSRLRVYKGK